MSDHYCCKNCGLRYDDCKCGSHAKSYEARQRMEIYQEGQRAFGSGDGCPYITRDWRKGTWTKGFEAARAHRKAMLAEATAPKNFTDDELTIEERVLALEARVMELQKALCRGNR